MPEDAQQNALGYLPPNRGIPSFLYSQQTRTAPLPATAGGGVRGTSTRICAMNAPKPSLLCYGMACTSTAILPRADHARPVCGSPGQSRRNVRARGVRPQRQRCGDCGIRFRSGFINRVNSRRPAGRLLMLIRFRWVTAPDTSRLRATTLPGRTTPTGEGFRPLCMTPTLVSITTITSVFSSQYIAAVKPSVPRHAPNLRDGCKSS